MKDDDAVEARLQELGLNAPRVTPEHTLSRIQREYYHVIPGTTVTIAALTLKNGFVVVGKSAAASKDNFNEELGRSIARQDAVSQIWALEGYLLKQALYEAENK